MPFLPLRTTALATIAAGLLLGACNSDSPVSPPDVPGCTRGTVAPGQTVAGALGSTSCLVSPTNGAGMVQTYAASWTLSAKPNTVYLVTFEHASVPPGYDMIQGDLYAYTRSAGGDPVLATGKWGEYGAMNVNNQLNQEMALITDVDRDFSLRIEAASMSDTGAYTLTVTSCPVTPITPGQSITGVDLGNGCPAAAFLGAPSRILTFFTFPVDSLHNYSATITPTSGQGLLLDEMVGPAPDLGCLIVGCTKVTKGSVLANGLVDSFSHHGLGTIISSVDPDSVRTITVALDTVPLAIAPPHP